MSEGGNFLEPLLVGDTKGLVEATQRALREGKTAEEVLQAGLLPAMEEVGVQFRNGDLYIPEVMLAARSMQEAMSVLKPALSKSSGAASGKVVIGTVKGDLHDIGKNLVVMMMEGGGFEVMDLGADVSADRFCEAVRSHRPAFLGLSALLTTTMPEMRKTITALEQAQLRKAVRVMVGGAPVTAAFAREIGADGYAPDATSVVSMMKSLL